MQTPLYYPHFDEKMQGLVNISDRTWERIIRQAIINGEIREDTNIQHTIIRFSNCFMGMGAIKCLAVEELDINEIDRDCFISCNSVKDKLLCISTFTATDITTPELVFSRDGWRQNVAKPSRFR